MSNNRGDNRAPIMQMLEAADWFVHIATNWQPDGMVEVLKLFEGLPEVLERVAKAFQLMSTQAQQRYPVRPVILDLIEGVQRHQRLTAKRSAEIAPTIRSVHREQIEALEDKRNAMWDHRANADRAGR